MMTHQKLNICQRYPCDTNDLFLRMASDEEQALLTTDDWILIYFYLDNMSLAKQGQLTAQALAEIEDQVFKECESQEVAIRFKNIIINQLSREKSLIRRFFHWILS